MNGTVQSKDVLMAKMIPDGKQKCEICGKPVMNIRMPSHRIIHQPNH